MKPAKPPKIAATASASTIVASPGRLWPKSVTTAIAPIAPIRNWPRPPMLKSPALKPRPTPSPARMSGVAYESVEPTPLG